MRKFSPSFLVACVSLISLSSGLLQAETPSNSDPKPADGAVVQTKAPTQPKPQAQAQNQAQAQVETKKPTKLAFEPFTGKVTKNKVRLRLQPNFDAPVVRELGQNDLIIVLNETEDFYTIRPSKEAKAYIFRTYVLDNVVEGTRVNVRLKPDLDAPVVAQLNSGDRVNGSVNPSNNKWLEIAMPEAVRFYVAKDYVTKIGDVTYIEKLERRQDDVFRLLNTTQAIAANEMQKPFEQINIDSSIANYNRIINEYKEFPEATEKAKDAIENLQINYTNKKIAYLESKALPAGQLEKQNKQLSAELQNQKAKLAQLEQEMLERAAQLALNDRIGHINSAPAFIPTQVPNNIATWIPVEEALFASWSKETGIPSMEAFYRDQKQQSFVMKGVVEPYNRPVKNRPGDYMLTSSASKLPIAFLYSTHVNLQNYVGHEVSIRVAPRANNHYAFPAYFVLTLE